MKKLKLLNLSTLMVLALLFSACGSDSDEKIISSNEAVTNGSKESSSSSTNNSNTTTNSTVSTWSDFYSRVEKGEFVSIDTFKANNGISNYSTVIFKFQKCSVDKAWIFNLTSCTSSFERYFMGSSLIREDNLFSKEEVHQTLKTIMASANSYYYYGGAKYGFYSNDVFYQIDLNYPLEVNPVSKQEGSSSDDDREIYTLKGYQYY